MTGRPARAPAARLVKDTGTGASWRALLLDSYQADRLCRAVRVAINNLAVGYPSLLHIDLRAELILPAEAYLVESWGGPADERRDDVVACRALIELAEGIAEKIEDGFPFHEGAGDSYAQRLRSAWSMFMEHTAVTELSAIRAKRSSDGKKGPQQRRENKSKNKAGETREEVLQSRVINRQDKQPLKKILSEIANEFGVGQRTIEADLKRLREKIPK